MIRQRVGTADEGLNMRQFPAQERESLVKQIEEEHIRVRLGYVEINYLADGI